ncbi:MAG: hypothetical protein K8T89_04345 [Planctomycetes bacterium]|nr:hypothetical protein [Planctomycetota bacterium]
MHSFRDNAGRTWIIAINVTMIKRVRGLVGVDLYQLIDDGFKPMGALISDPVKLADVLYCLCKDEADTKQITDEDFGRSLYGDAITLAADAFVEELIDFFPEARTRASLRKVVTAGRTVRERILDHAERKIDAVDPEKIARDEINRIQATADANRSSGSSGNSPVSSASTLDLSPSMSL